MASRRFDELYPQGGAATARGMMGVAPHADSFGRPMPAPADSQQVPRQQTLGQHAHGQPVHGQPVVEQQAHAQPSAGQEWLVLINPAMRRMMSTREVQAEVRAGTLPRETLAWRAGMSEWAALGAIQELGLPNRNPTVRTTPALGWDAPLAPTARPEEHVPPRQHPGVSMTSHHASAPSPQLVLELMSAGAVAMLIVALTTYLLSVGGAFQPGSAHHTEPQAPAATH
jgi:uncharacterized protein DUF4339